MKVTHSKKAKFTSLSTRFLPALLTLAAVSTASVRAQSVWNSTSGSWSADFNWASMTVPVSDFTTQLVFNATESYTVTNDIGAGTFNLNRITVNNTGEGATVTINGAAAANTLTFGGDNPTLDITGNVDFRGLMVGTATVTKTGPGTFLHNSNNTGFTGTLIVDQGTFVNRAPTNNDTTNFNPVSIVVNNGGTYQFGAATVGNPNLPDNTYITVNTGGVVSWQEGEDFGGFHLQGGTIVLQNGGANFPRNPSAQEWTHGTLTAPGAVFVLTANKEPINKTTPGTVIINGNAALNGTSFLNIMEGTVSMASAANLGLINVSFGDAGGATAGTFDYLGVTATRTGDFSFNTGGGVIRVDSATTVLTLSGTISGIGNLSKTGPGRLRLTGSLGTTGTTTVNEGSLQVEPGNAFGGFAVAANTVLLVNSTSGTISLNVPSLNLASGTSTLQFDLDTNAVTTVPLAMVTSLNGLTITNTGTPTIKLTNLKAFAPGTYTLLDYSGTPITSGLNVSLPGRTIGALVYDTANTRIDLAITGDDTVKWAGGVNGDWDLGTAAGIGGTNNWRLAAAGTQTNFIDTDGVTFDDTATRFDVNLAATVRPNSVLVNANSNYSVSGAGKISGTTSVVKSGTGIFALATDNNDYIGGTFVTAGTFQIGNGGTTGSVGGTITLNGGTLGFNRSDNYVFPNTVAFEGAAGISQNGSGTITIANSLLIGANTVDFGGTGILELAAGLAGIGVINKNGSGTLTLLGNNNPFTGTLNINAGTVILDDREGSGGDLNASSIVVNNGGTFIFGPNTAAGANADLGDLTTKFTINTGGLVQFALGENYGGFILEGGEFRIVRNGRNVNSNAITNVDGTTVYELHSGTITSDESSGNAVLAQDPSPAGAPVFGVLTKTTSGTVTVSGAITFEGTLALQIKEGTLSMGLGNFPSGGAAMVTMGDFLTSGRLEVTGVGSTGTNRPFTLAEGGGTFHLPDPDTNVAINGAVSGPGSLTKTGKGTLSVGGANDYTGATVIADGTLEANNFVGSATGSGSVLVSGTLSGEGGIITGNDKDIVINGILQPGFTGAMQGGDFSLTAGVGGSTIFGAASVSRFDLWSTMGVDQSANPAAADLLIAAGDFEITAGAVLKLTNPNALTFQAGDVFRLFDWTAIGTRTGFWSIDASDLNLGTFEVDSSNLYTSGTIAIVVPEPSTALLAILGLTPCLLRRRRTGGTAKS